MPDDADYIADPEIRVIGVLLKACSDGKAAGLDKKAWRRVADYAASLFAQQAQVAGDVELVVEAPPQAARSQVVNRKDERRQKRKEGWHVLGRHPRRACPKLDG